MTDEVAHTSADASFAADIRPAPQLAGPIIVLTYEWSGFVRLRSMLERCPGIGWIGGVNLVQLCDQMLTVWREVEDAENAHASVLAQKSVKAFLDTMLTPRLAADGGTRWCNAAVATPFAAESFTQLYPAARFICMHRACTDVIYSGVAAAPWGLSGYRLAALAASHPGNTVAALAEYWVRNTLAILDFERDHPDRSWRLRYEDLLADPVGTGRMVSEFAGLGQIPATAYDTRALPAAVGAAGSGLGSEVPIENIPEHLLVLVNELQSRLGYS